jgi:hypothetical protein
MVMSKNGFLISLLASLATATLGLGGCSVQNTPHAPTFESDIKEITASRCVRCHGAGGTLNGDPDSINPKGAPIDGFFDRMEDDCPDAKPFGCHGLGHYATNPADTRLHDYIHRIKGALPMPPTPAPALTSSQLDIFDLWLANGAPAN